MLRNAKEMHLIEFKRIFQNWFGKEEEERKRKKQIDYKDRSKLSRSKNLINRVVFTIHGCTTLCAKVETFLLLCQMEKVSQTRAFS